MLMFTKNVNKPVFPVLVNQTRTCKYVNWNEQLNGGTVTNSPCCIDVVELLLQVAEPKS